MRFVNPIAFVRDVAAARAFWRDVVGLTVKADFGTFVLFETGFALHDGAALSATVFGATRPVPDRFGSDNVLFYFESADLDAVFARIAPHVELVHGIKVQPWGQRVFRFRDPEGCLVEIGDPMDLAP